MKKVLLKGVGLKKYFDLREPFGIRRRVIKAVDGLDIEINEKETLGLAGESGCGKSTLGRVLLRLIKPTAGRVFFLDQDITEVSEREIRKLRKDMQIVLQNPYASLNPRLRILKSVGEGLEVNGGYTKREIREIVAQLFVKVGLKREYLEKYPHELSGGERQRVCIARALVLKPRIIVADEPVSALDVTIQSQILDLFLRLQEEMFLSYLFITHDLRVLRHIAHRSAIMYLGKIVELGETEEIFNNPLHPYTEILLNSIPPEHPAKRRKVQLIPAEIPSATDLPSGCRFRTRCPYAFNRCKDEVPELKEVIKNHWVACFLR